MGIATRVVQAMVVLGGSAAALLLVSHYWPASALERQARAALEAPRSWPGSNAWADLLFIARDDLDAAGRQAALAAHVAAVDDWHMQRRALLRDNAGKDPEQWVLPPSPSVHSGKQPALPDALADCRHGTPQTCLAALAAHPAVAGQWRDAHAGYLSRRAALSAHGHLASPYAQPDPATMLALFGGHLAGSGRVAQALDHLQGNQAAAVTGACQDLATARLLAGRSDSLMAASTGMRGLEDGAAWLAALADGWPASQPLPAACAVVAAPLSVDEVSLCNAFAGEYSLSQGVLADGIAAMGEGWLAGWLLDADKTADRAAANLGRSCLAPAQAEIAADTAVVLDPAQVPSLWHIRCLSNATGCLLMGVATPAYRDFLLRMQDAAASQRLLGAWLWLQQQPVQGDLPSVLAQLPADYQTPARPIGLSGDGHALEVARHHSGDTRGDTLQLPLPAAWAQAASVR